METPKNIDIYNEFKEKGNKAADDVATLAIRADFLLEQVLEGTDSSNKRVKNAAAKALRIISETKPVKLYPKFSFFAGLLKVDSIEVR